MSYLPFALEALFPKLNRRDYMVTSPPTGAYNCIAHAAQDETRWWWPGGPGTYWPISERAETVDCFIAAYASIGYEICPTQTRSPEAQFERVAIYVDATGKPTHAARQLPDGTWTSKLGPSQDIRHNALEHVEDSDGKGLGYGTVAVILRRKK
jgi:hypothetical protein